VPKQITPHQSFKFRKDVTMYVKWGWNVTRKVRRKQKKFQVSACQADWRWMGHFPSSWPTLPAASTFTLLHFPPFYLVFPYSFKAPHSSCRKLVSKMKQSAREQKIAVSAFSTTAKNITQLDMRSIDDVCTLIFIF